MNHFRRLWYVVHQTRLSLIGRATVTLRDTFVALITRKNKHSFNLPSAATTIPQHLLTTRILPCHSSMMQFTWFICINDSTARMSKSKVCAGIDPTIPQGGGFVPIIPWVTWRLIVALVRWTSKPRALNSPSTYAITILVVWRFSSSSFSLSTTLRVVVRVWAWSQMDCCFLAL
jgi:hypothetical protein